MDIDKFISENKIDEALDLSLSKNLTYLSLLINKIEHDKEDNDNELSDSYKKTLGQIDHDNKDVFFTDIEKEYLNKTKRVKVLLTCNWMPNKDICNVWNKMSKNNDYKWNSIEIVWEEPCDFYCIINKPFDPNFSYKPEKTIVFRMEPNMEKNLHMWGEWSTIPNSKDFKFVGFHEKYFNNNEWHLSKNYNQLSNETIGKNAELSSVLSTILSDKYSDPGHIKRIDFMKFVEKKGGVNVDVFGNNKFLWKNYKGSLPHHKKDKSLFPYKYSFNVENFSIQNYYTEKLIDGILSETLVFYSGCFNAKDYIDERAFVYLELSNFEHDYEIIKKAIEDDLWSQRLPFIKEAKKKILNELQFFPRLEKIITP
jgi:hypothetical protein